MPVQSLASLGRHCSPGEDVMVAGSPVVHTRRQVLGHILLGFRKVLQQSVVHRMEHKLGWLELAALESRNKLLEVLLQYPHQVLPYVLMYMPQAPDLDCMGEGSCHSGC